MPAVHVLPADRDGAHSGERPDSPQVVMQVLAARTEVAERAFSGPDCVRDAAGRREGRRESEPAEQGGTLPRVQFLMERGAHPTSEPRHGTCHGVCHTRTILAQATAASQVLGPGPGCGPGHGRWGSGCAWVGR